MVTLSSMSRLLGFITQLSCLLARDLEQMTSSIDPLGFPDSSVRKESTCNVRDTSLIPGSGRSAGEGISYPLQFSWASLVAQLVKNLPVIQETWEPWVGKILGEGRGYPLQYSGLENSMDYTVHGIIKSWT